MKKQILSLATFALLTLSLTYTGCKKDNKDTTNPSVSVNGDATTYSQMGKPYSDAGATANDDTDGSISTSTSGSVNTAVAGTYILTYTAKDAAGNTGTATRTVYVVQFDGNYGLFQSACTDTTANSTSPTIVSVSASGVSALNGMTIGDFGLYSPNTVSATFSGTSITVPVQSSNTGVTGDKIQATGIITGNGTISSPIKFTFQFKETDAAGATFNQGTATLTHQ